jgi:ferredoxin/flavodoxin
MSDRRRLSVLYFSGTGGTKLVAELLGELLSDRFACDIRGIEDPRAAESAKEGDFLVFLYPTYYLGPAPSMVEFVRKLAPGDRLKAAYILTTCELYSENSIRRMALRLKERGIIAVGSKVVHAPGSDLTLVIPGVLIPWWYRFEKALPAKLRLAAREIAAAAEASLVRESIPWPKWYTPFTQLFQVLVLNRFDLFRHGLRVLPERCSSCGACARLCDRGAWSMEGGRPIHSSERCELCGRCLHHCPKKAIVILKGLRDNRRLDSGLYGRLGDEARSKLGLGRGGDAK